MLNWKKGWWNTWGSASGSYEIGGNNRMAKIICLSSLLQATNAGVVEMHHHPADIIIFLEFDARALPGAFDFYIADAACHL